MPNVYTWPPVHSVATLLSQNRAMSTSFGLAGTPYSSLAQRTRRIWSVRVPGIGKDGQQQGYIETLKVLLDGKLPLVRATPCPRYWWKARGQEVANLNEQTLTWFSNPNGAAVAWDGAEGGAAVAWRFQPEIYEVGTNDDGWHFLRLRYLPRGNFAIPGEKVSFGGREAFVVNTAIVGDDGRTTVYLTEDIGATVGPASNFSLNVRESIVFFMDDFPNAMQPAVGSYYYEFEMFEVFAEEFADGFTEVSPPWT